MIWFVAGLAFGFVVDVIWSRTPGLQEGHTLNDRMDYFGIIEHYHHALWLMMAWLFIKWDFLLGVSASLWASEWIQDPARPFGLSKDHFLESTYVGIAMAVILGILYLIIY